jgi:hypothetical protein
MRCKRSDLESADPLQGFIALEIEKVSLMAWAFLAAKRYPI